ncbi:MAG: AraC family transcriptional regulator [Bacteroidales bacterium]|jgi:AraC-like DNA-binding protein|nr:AraC family transcriptional regulator [Bacteroidales bacterium]
MEKNKKKSLKELEINLSKAKNDVPVVKGNIILEYEEHAVCSNWTSDYRIGFKGYHFKNNDRLTTDFGKEFHTMCFLLKGTATLYYNDRAYELQENTMFLIPNSVTCVIEAKTKGFILVNHFDKPLGRHIDTCERMSLESITPAYNKDNEMYNPVIEIRPALQNFLTLLTQIINDGVYCKHFHNEEFNKLFFLLRFYYSKQEIGIFLSPVLGSNLDFKHLVLTNYHKITCIKDLAVLCGYSLATFNRLFMENFHDTPYKWLQKKKLQVVINYLYDQNLSISQIADLTGFSSSGHLTVFCKEFLHLTPSQFRKQHRQFNIEAKKAGLTEDTYNE